MLGLDITSNNDYTDSDAGLEVWGITALQVYSYTLQFSTLVDEKWTGNEQRRAQWTLPRRTWTLEFQKTPALGRKLEQFFLKTMGKFKTFKFKWAKTYAEDGTDCGGDDNWYFVRFDSDSLKIEVDYMGYRHTTIDIIEVRNASDGNSL